MDRILEILLQGPGLMVDKDLTSGGLIMLTIVLTGTAVVLFVLAKHKSNWLAHYATLCLTIFTFEVFTSPMWINNNLGRFGYAYQDVSWVLTLGWASLMMGLILCVDYYWKLRSAWQRFLLYLGGMSILGFFGEVLVTHLGLRAYAPEIIAVVSPITLLNVPIDVFYYVPIFSALVIGCYRYLGFILDKEPIVPTQGGWIRRFLLAMSAVFLFEFMIEPMVQNQGFPEWSYIFRDISFLQSLLWVFLMWLAWLIVELLWRNFNQFEKLCLSVATIGLLAMPVEAFFIRNGFRVYEGTSAGTAFSGVGTPLLGIPLEVTLAIPMYFFLVFGFVKCWDVMLTNPHHRYLLTKK